MLWFLSSDGIEKLGLAPFPFFKLKPIVAQFFEFLLNKFFYFSMADLSILSCPSSIRFLDSFK